MTDKKEGLLARLLYTLPQLYDWSTQFISLWNWEKWQRRVFEDITGTDILEIGVGPGRLYLSLLKQGYNVVGIETRKGMADVARRRIKKAGFKAKIHLTSAYSLPFTDESFDSIIMTFVLSEIHDLHRAIAEMRRVLKKGGKVIAVNISQPLDNNLIGRNILRIINKSSDFNLDRYSHEYFQKAGFVVKRVDFGPFNILNKIVAIKK